MTVRSSNHVILLKIPGWDSVRLMVEAQFVTPGPLLWPFVVHGCTQRFCLGDWGWSLLLDDFQNAETIF